jgi:hypothetical protein
MNHVGDMSDFGKDYSKVQKSTDDQVKHEVDEAIRKNREDEAKAQEERLKKVREAQSDKKQPPVNHPIYRSF